MPRSSGQNAIPARAIRLGIRSIISAPPNFTLPSRRPTIPMIDFMVVVLPAPLRPSKVTTSPLRTSKFTPCRMWLSPYQAFRPLTSSMPASGMHELTSEVGGDHFRVSRNVGVIAFGQDAASCQHSDGIAQSFHNGQVVLDHQDRAADADAADQF